MANGNGNGIVRAIFDALRKVPLGMWLAFLGQLAAVLYWLFTVEQRGAKNAETLASLVTRVEQMDQRDTRAGNLVSQRVDGVERQVQDTIKVQRELLIKMQKDIVTNSDRIDEVLRNEARIEDRTNRIVQALDTMYSLQTEMRIVDEALAKRIERLEQQR